MTSATTIIFKYQGTSHLTLTTTTVVITPTTQLEIELIACMSPMGAFVHINHKGKKGWSENTMTRNHKFIVEIHTHKILENATLTLP